MDAFISLKTITGIKRVPLSSISYFIAENGKCYVKYTDGDKERVYCTLDNLEDSLDYHNLYRIHNKFLLNLDQEYIYCSQTRDIELPNGETLTVARDRKKDFTDRMLNGFN